MDCYQIGSLQTKVLIEAHKQKLTLDQIDETFCGTIDRLGWAIEGICDGSPAGPNFLERFKILLGNYRVKEYDGAFGFPTIRAFLAKRYFKKLYSF